jgi:hypothetical protein
MQPTAGVSTPDWRLLVRDLAIGNLFTGWGILPAAIRSLGKHNPFRMNES